MDLKINAERLHRLYNIADYNLDEEQTELFIKLWNRLPLKYIDNDRMPAHVYANGETASKQELQKLMEYRTLPYMHENYEDFNLSILQTSLNLDFSRHLKTLKDRYLRYSPEHPNRLLAFPKWVERQFTAKDGSTPTQALLDALVEQEKYAKDYSSIVTSMTDVGIMTSAQKSEIIKRYLDVLPKEPVVEAQSVEQPEEPVVEEQPVEQPEEPVEQAQSVELPKLIVPPPLVDRAPPRQLVVQVGDEAPREVAPSMVALQTYMIENPKNAKQVGGILMGVDAELDKSLLGKKNAFFLDAYSKIAASTDKTAACEKHILDRYEMIVPYWRQWMTTPLDPWAEGYEKIILTACKSFLPEPNWSLIQRIALKTGYFSITSEQAEAIGKIPVPNEVISHIDKMKSALERLSKYYPEYIQGLTVSEYIDEYKADAFAKFFGLYVGVYAIDNPQSYMREAFDHALKELMIKEQGNSFEILVYKHINQNTADFAIRKTKQIFYNNARALSNVLPMVVLNVANNQNIIMNAAADPSALLLAGVIPFNFKTVSSLVMSGQINPISAIINTGIFGVSVITEVPTVVVTGALAVGEMAFDSRHEIPRFWNSPLEPLFDATVPTYINELSNRIAEQWQIKYGAKIIPLQSIATGILWPADVASYPNDPERLLMAEHSRPFFLHVAESIERVMAVLEMDSVEINELMGPVAFNLDYPSMMNTFNQMLNNINSIKLEKLRKDKDFDDMLDLAVKETYTSMVRLSTYEAISQQENYSKVALSSGAATLKMMLQDNLAYVSELQERLTLVRSAPDHVNLAYLVQNFLLDNPTSREIVTQYKLRLLSMYRIVVANIGFLTDKEVQQFRIRFHVSLYVLSAMHITDDNITVDMQVTPNFNQYDLFESYRTNFAGSETWKTPDSTISLSTDNDIWNALVGAADDKEYFEAATKLSKANCDDMLYSTLYAAVWNDEIVLSTDYLSQMEILMPDFKSLMKSVVERTPLASILQSIGMTDFFGSHPVDVQDPESNEVGSLEDSNELMFVHGYYNNLGMQISQKTRDRRILQMQQNLFDMSWPEWNKSMTKMGVGWFEWITHGVYKLVVQLERTGVAVSEGDLGTLYDLYKFQGSVLTRKILNDVWFVGTNVIPWVKYLAKWIVPFIGAAYARYRLKSKTEDNDKRKVRKEEAADDGAVSTERKNVGEAWSDATDQFYYGQFEKSIGMDTKFNVEDPVVRQKQVQQKVEDVERLYIEKYRSSVPLFIRAIMKIKSAIYRQKMTPMLFEFELMLLT